MSSLVAVGSGSAAFLMFDLRSRLVVLMILPVKLFLWRRVLDMWLLADFLDRTDLLSSESRPPGESSTRMVSPRLIVRLPAVNDSMVFAPAVLLACLVPPRREMLNLVWGLCVRARDPRCFELTDRLSIYELRVKSSWPMFKMGWGCNSMPSRMQLSLPRGF